MWGADPVLRVREPDDENYRWYMFVCPHLPGSSQRHIKVIPRLEFTRGPFSRDLNALIILAGAPENADKDASSDTVNLSPKRKRPPCLQEAIF